jgi:hypothetical protein
LCRDCATKVLFISSLSTFWPKAGDHTSERISQQIRHALLLCGSGQQQAKRAKDPLLPLRKDKDSSSSFAEQKPKAAPHIASRF